jgi:hypothetical protein
VLANIDAATGRRDVATEGNCVMSAQSHERDRNYGGDIECFASILILLRRKGVSVRSLAKCFGWSKSSMGRLVQVIDESLVAGAVDLFEQERRNDFSVEAIADHLKLPVAVVLGALNRMLRADDDEESQMGQHDEKSLDISEADPTASVPNAPAREMQG